MTSPRRRPSGSLTAALGLVGVPGAAVAFTVVILTVALTAVGWGATRPVHLPDGSLSLYARVGLATALVMLAQLAALRFRLGPGTAAVGWAEAALAVGLYLTPAGWLPAAAFVGAVVAWVLRGIGGDQRSPFEILTGAAGLTVAAGAGAVAAASVVDPLGAPLTSATVLAVLLGCLVNLAVGTGLAAAALRLRHGGSLCLIIWRSLRSRLPMFIGNVIIGVTAIGLLQHEPFWVLLLVPPLWLLHRTYRYHLRAGDDRRMWQAFAAATAALKHLQEAEVARAGLHGARELFGATRVQIDVVGADGQEHRYVGGDAAAEPTGGDAPAGPAGRPPALPTAVVRSMAVAGARIGELAMWLPEAWSPTARDELVLSAYCDALACALHDAAMHERLTAAAARSSHDAVHDALTGLANRAALMGGGDEALRRLPPGDPVALLLVDLKDFTNVNGTLGHSAGDELLRLTAERLAGVAAPDELVARVGDDEFALIVPRMGGGVTVAGDTEAEARVLRRAADVVAVLRAPAEVAGVRLVVETTVGAVVARAGVVDTGELLRRAQVAIEHARSVGGVVVYDADLDTASTDRLVLLADFRDALTAGDQLHLVLQPAVDLGTGEPTGVEALSRWRHPRRGLLNPTEFIRAVEDSDLLGDFTRFVLDRSLATAAAWRADGIDVPISVNLSARSLLHASLPAEVEAALRRHRVPAHRLVLEITESVAVVDFEIVDEVVAGLRALGVQLSVDDFGTGYSSLAFLTRVPVDELKVDRSFVERMVDSAEAAAIVRSTVALGRNLNVRVVAEGVETADQRAALLQLGCTVGQGYHFCKPLPSDRIVAVLRSLSAAASAKVLPLRADGAG